MMPSLPLYNRAIPITPHNSTNFANIGGQYTCEALNIGVGGVVTVVFEDDALAAITVVAGQVLPVKVKRVNATGTTATGVVALYRV
jgi:hypothetical protein